MFAEERYFKQFYYPSVFVQEAHASEIDDKGADLNYYRTLNYGLNMKVKGSKKKTKRRIKGGYSNVKCKKMLKNVKSHQLLIFMAVIVGGYFLFSDSKSNDIELTQYLSPVLFFGPSSKTWPKCPSQFAHSISVLGRPKIELSSLYIIASSLTASKKTWPTTARIIF